MWPWNLPAELKFRDAEKLEKEFSNTALCSRKYQNIKCYRWGGNHFLRDCDKNSSEREPSARDQYRCSREEIEGKFHKGRK